MTLCGSVNVILNHPHWVYYIKHTAAGMGNLFHQRPSLWEMGLAGQWRGTAHPKMGFPPPGQVRDVRDSRVLVLGSRCCHSLLSLG